MSSSPRTLASHSPLRQRGLRGVRETDQPVGYSREMTSTQDPDWPADARSARRGRLPSELDGHTYEQALFLLVTPATTFSYEERSAISSAASTLNSGLRLGDFTKRSMRTPRSRRRSSMMSPSSRSGEVGIPYHAAEGYIEQLSGGPQSGRRRGESRWRTGGQASRADRGNLSTSKSPPRSTRLEQQHCSICCVSVRRIRREMGPGVRRIFRQAYVAHFTAAVG